MDVINVVAENVKLELTIILYFLLKTHVNDEINQKPTHGYLTSRFKTLLTYTAQAPRFKQSNYVIHTHTQLCFAHSVDLNCIKIHPLELFSLQSIFIVPTGQKAALSK